LGLYEIGEKKRKREGDEKKCYNLGRLIS